jgi:pimeloyl-ACP methyl ester carboxylesterase
LTAPAPATIRIAGEDGIAVAVHRWGPPGGQPPVVLLHGFVADTRSFWVAPGIVAALLAAGRAVVGIDARGHGQSDKPHDPDRYGETVMAADVRRVTGALGLAGYDLVGYSMGAVVALLVAVEDPRVRRLVVGGIGSGVVELGGLDTRSVRSEAMVAALEAEEAGAVARSGAAGFRRLADRLGADRLALAAHARRVHDRPIPLHEVRAPVLVLAGDADPLAARPQLLADALPRGRLALVPGNHLGAVATPRFRAALVDFLGPTSGGTP